MHSKPCRQNGQLKLIVILALVSSIMAPCMTLLSKFELPAKSDRQGEASSEEAGLDQSHNPNFLLIGRIGSYITVIYKCLHKGWLYRFALVV